MLKKRLMWSQTPISAVAMETGAVRQRGRDRLSLLSHTSRPDQRRNPRPGSRFIDHSCLWTVFTMAAQDREDIQPMDKVSLGRKLTGPSRLLLGKTRTSSVADDRPETKTEEMEKTNGGKTSLKPSTAAAEPTEAPTMEGEVSDPVEVESCRGRHGDHDITNRKLKRRRYLSRFIPAIVCIRRQKKNREESSEKQKNQEADSPLLNTTEEDSDTVSKVKKRFNMMENFRWFRTSSIIQTLEQTAAGSVKEDRDKSSLTFQKKLRRFFSKRRRGSSSAVPREDMEDKRTEEGPCLSDAQVDERPALQSNGAGASSEDVTVIAEMNIQAAAKSPEKEPGADTGSTGAAGGSEKAHTDEEPAGVIQDSNKASVEAVMELAAVKADEVFAVVLDFDGNLSASSVPSDEASELQHEKQMDQTTLQPTRPFTNGPSFRIELVTDDVGLEDEEDEFWQGREPENQNQNHLLLLLSPDHSEQQLLHMARSLVRDAMNAAVDQLSREQQSGSGCVHREPQGCRDHA